MKKWILTLMITFFANISYAGPQSPPVSKYNFYIKKPSGRFTYIDRNGSTTAHPNVWGGHHYIGNSRFTYDRRNIWGGRTTYGR